MVKMFEEGGNETLKGSIEALVADPSAKWIDKVLRNEANFYGFNEVKHLVECHAVNLTREHDLHVELAV